MSFFSNLATIFGFSKSSTDDEECIPAPSGSVFYEMMPIPEGPGIQQLQDVLGLLPPVNIKTGPWIAGGCARRLLQGKSLEEADIDLFFKNTASWNEFCDHIEKQDIELVVKTDRAKTFKINGIQVQCINRRHYLSLEEVFKDFDFSVCQIATDGNQLACTAQAHKDIMDNVLRPAPNGKTAKRTLVPRMIKYTGYGFKPEPGFFELVVKSGLDYTSAYAIFEGNDIAIYDEDEGGCVEEMIPTEELDAGVMRTIARELGLETNV